MSKYTDETIKNLRSAIQEEKLISKQFNDPIPEHCLQIESILDDLEAYKLRAGNAERRCKKWETVARFFADPYRGCDTCPIKSVVENCPEEEGCHPFILKWASV